MRTEEGEGQNVTSASGVRQGPGLDQNEVTVVGEETMVWVVSRGRAAGDEGLETKDISLEILWNFHESSNNLFLC